MTGTVATANGPTTPGDDPLDEYRVLVDEMAGAGWTLSAAESLTAGRLCARIADVPGASRVLRGGLVVYATDLKHELAGVPTEVLDTQGAVAGATAEALARGVRARCASDIGVGLTGVAGPDRQEGKPVGTVFVAVAGPDEDCRTERLALSGDRGEIRDASCDAAVRAVRSVLGEHLVTDVGNDSGDPRVVPGDE